MKNLMTIYIAYLDPDIYYKHTLSLLEEAKKNYDEVLAKMEKDMVGSKLINQKETVLNSLLQYLSPR